MVFNATFSIFQSLTVLEISGPNGLISISFVLFLFTYFHLLGRGYKTDCHDITEIL
jgi:hypothetical protein